MNNVEARRSHASPIKIFGDLPNPKYAQPFKPHDLRLGFSQKLDNFLPFCPSARTSSVRSSRQQAPNTQSRVTRTSEQHRRNSLRIGDSVDLYKRGSSGMSKEGNKIKELQKQYLSSELSMTPKQEPERKLGKNTSWKVRTGS